MPVNKMQRGLSRSIFEQMTLARTSEDKKLLLELSESNDLAVRMSLAQNKNLSFALIVKLANDDVADVRKWISLHEKAPIYVLNRLAEDQSASVRALLSGNPNTSSEILLKLAQDQDNRVGYLLAQQGRLTAEVVEVLIETYQNDNLVISRLAKNPYLNKKVKQMLYILTGNESFRESLRMDNNLGEK